MNILRSLKVLASTVVLGVGLAAAGPASAFFTLSFDENGNGIIDMRDGTVAVVQGVLVADATTTTGFALSYALPNFVGSGDVLVYDANGISDVLRFYNGANTSYMSFYSLYPGPNLADTGLPNNYNPNGPIVFEDATDHFAFYSGGTPGVNNDYLGVSSVPEPASWALMAAGLLGMAGAARRRIG